MPSYVKDRLEKAVSAPMEVLVGDTTKLETYMGAVGMTKEEYDSIDWAELMAEMGMSEDIHNYDGCAV